MKKTSQVYVYMHVYLFFFFGSTELYEKCVITLVNVNVEKRAGTELS